MKESLQRLGELKSIEILFSGLMDVKYLSVITQNNGKEGMLYFRWKIFTFKVLPNFPPKWFFRNITCIISNFCTMTFKRNYL